MGWLFGHSTRAELIAEVTKTFENDQHVQTCTKKFFSGNNLWTVWERKSKLAPTDVERFIVLIMMQGKNGYCGWGYKDVSEEMGPYQHTCPLSFFDGIEPPNEYAKQFRERCRLNHARKNQTFSVGQVIKLTNGREYKITAKRGRNYYGDDVLTGNGFILPRAMFTIQTEAI